MPDAAFADPRLAPLYDRLEGPRDDLDAYVSLVTSLGAQSVLDVGCGTGVLALRLADLGLSVTGVDPAGASLDVALAKPSAASVRWVCGTVAAVPASPPFDLAVMTGNVAMALVDREWAATLAALSSRIRRDGHLVLESRVPAARAWEGWTPDAARTEREGVAAWCEVTSVDWPLVSFRWTYELPDETLTSDSTLQFRELDELVADLAAHGFTVDEVRDAPDRPGLEHVLVARR